MIGKRLKELRIEKDLLQKELAEKLNLSQQTISLYESDSREPDAEILLKIAEFFSVSTDYLLGKSNKRSNESEQPKTLEDYIKDAESLMLYGEVMDEDDKQALLTAIRVAYETAIKKKNKKE